MNFRALKVLVVTIIVVLVGTPWNGNVKAQRGQGAGNAQSAVVQEPINGPAAQSAAEVLAYWTPENLASAQQVDLRGALDAFAVEPAASAEASVSMNGAAPTVAMQPNNTNLLLDPSTVPAYQDQAAALGEGEDPAAYGTSNLPYSNSRNVPFAASTDNTYPYRTIGKWFFTKPGIGNFQCSASVIRHRIVVTAGHCLHSGNGSATGWFTNFLFVPAYRNGAAPFGTWTRFRCAVTTTWFNGGGGVPNAADYGMCDMNDRNGVRIGSALGFLGWQTGALALNHVHIFGYPGNLDNGVYMNQTSAGGGRFNGNNTYIYGSNQRQGVSGGPYIQNFGLAPTCSVGCSATLNGRLQVVGIASYLNTSTSPHYSGSSLPDSRWVSVYNLVCSFRAGNCS